MIFTECSIERNIPQYARVLATLHFSLNFISAVQIEEIVIEHKLAKDTLREWY